MKIKNILFTIILLFMNKIICETYTTSVYINDNTYYTTITTTGNHTTIITSESDPSIIGRFDTGFNGTPILSKFSLKNNKEKIEISSREANELIRTQKIETNELYQSNMYVTEIMSFRELKRYKKVLLLVNNDSCSYEMVIAKCEIDKKPYDIIVKYSILK